MRRIDAVLFDLGETLWHIPQMPPVELVRAETVRRITALLERWGFPIDERARTLGRDIRIATEAAERSAFCGDRRSPDYAAIVAEIAGRRGFPLTSAQAERLWETWNLGGQFFGRRLFDDALPTLQWLKGRGVRLAIVTNRAFGGSHFQQELAACGLADLFDGIAVSCTVGYMKPHPEIFRAALAQIHAAPERAAHVGDSLVADVAGAQALGITAIWKRGRLNETANGIRPDFTIERLAELQTLDIWQGAG